MLLFYTAEEIDIFNRFNTEAKGGLFGVIGKHKKIIIMHRVIYGSYELYRIY